MCSSDWYEISIRYHIWIVRALRFSTLMSSFVCILEQSLHSSKCASRNSEQHKVPALIHQTNGKCAKAGGCTRLASDLSAQPQGQTSSLRAHRFTRSRGLSKPQLDVNSIFHERKELPCASVCGLEHACETTVHATSQARTNHRKCFLIPMMKYSGQNVT